MSEQQEAEFCSECHAEGATLYCLACASPLCEDCRKSITPHTRHEIQIVTMAHRPPFCAHHTDKALSFFCEECKIVCCETCGFAAGGVHGEHKVKPVATVAAAVRHELQTLTETVAELLSSKLTTAGTDGVQQQTGELISKAVEEEALKLDHCVRASMTLLTDVASRALASKSAQNLATVDAMLKPPRSVVAGFQEQVATTNETVNKVIAEAKRAETLSDYLLLPQKNELLHNLRRAAATLRAFQTPSPEQLKATVASFADKLLFPVEAMAQVERAIAASGSVGEDFLPAPTLREQDGATGAKDKVALYWLPPMTLASKDLGMCWSELEMAIGGDGAELNWLKIYQGSDTMKFETRLHPGTYLFRVRWRRVTGVLWSFFSPALTVNIRQVADRDASQFPWNLKVGDFLDCVDTRQKVEPAIVIGATPTDVHIHYTLWDGPRWDEWIARSSSRLIKASQTMEKTLSTIGATCPWTSRYIAMLRQVVRTELGIRIKRQQNLDKPRFADKFIVTPPDTMFAALIVLMLEASQQVKPVLESFRSTALSRDSSTLLDIHIIADCPRISNKSIVSCAGDAWPIPADDLTDTEIARRGIQKYCSVTIFQAIHDKTSLKDCIELLKFAHEVEKIRRKLNVDMMTAAFTPEVVATLKTLETITDMPRSSPMWELSLDGVECTQFALQRIRVVVPVTTDVEKLKTVLCR